MASPPSCPRLFVPPRPAWCHQPGGPVWEAYPAVVLRARPEGAPFPLLLHGSASAMLGRDHALSGAVVVAALAPPLHVGIAHLAAGVVLGAGAGVLPDIDHPDSTISRSFGFLTEWFAWVVDRISGGHRHGTHSLVGIAAFTAGAYGAGLFQLSEPKALTAGHLGFSWHIVPAALVLALLYSSALRALHIGGHFGDLIGVAAALVTCYTGADLVQLTV